MSALSLNEPVPPKQRSRSHPKRCSRYGTTSGTPTLYVASVEENERVLHEVQTITSTASDVKEVQTVAHAGLRS